MKCRNGSPAGWKRRITEREIFAVVSLDTQNRPISAEVVSIGQLSSCQVGIPEVFRHAILACAAFIICFHNHPASGMEASGDDLRVTKRMKGSGELLGIKLLDHIIVGDAGSYLSLKEEGYLEKIQFGVFCSNGKEWGCAVNREWSWECPGNRDAPFYRRKKVREAGRRKDTYRKRRWGRCL